MALNDGWLQAIVIDGQRMFIISGGIADIASQAAWSHWPCDVLDQSYHCNIIYRAKVYKLQSSVIYSQFIHYAGKIHER